MSAFSSRSVQNNFLILLRSWKNVDPGLLVCGAETLMPRIQDSQTTIHIFAAVMYSEPIKERGFCKINQPFRLACSRDWWSVGPKFYVTARDARSEIVSFKVIVNIFKESPLWPQCVTPVVTARSTSAEINAGNAFIGIRNCVICVREL